jgi:hypothetical protein
VPEQEGPGILPLVHLIFPLSLTLSLSSTVEKEKGERERERSGAAPPVEAKPQKG